MNKLLILLFLGATIVTFGQLPLDTVYYDDFSTNKTTLLYPSRKDGWVKVENGYAHQFAEGKKKLRFASRLFWTVRFKTVLTQPDTFVYELQMKTGVSDVAGAAFEFSKQRDPVAYIGFMAGRRWVSIKNYVYGVHDNTVTYLYESAPELNSGDYFFRVVFGNNTLYFYCNDKLYLRQKMRPRKTWNDWGWIMLKSGDVKVDYVLLRAK
jgi:hypothetical protein